MEIFNDPSTILNKIVPDLQSIIIEYHRTFPMFVIGPYTKSYDDYRLLALCDVDQVFIDALSKFYEENKGIPSIDDCQGSIISGYNCEFHLDTHILRSSESVIKKGNIVFFNTLYHDHLYLSGHMNEIEVITDKLIQHIENIGLFVRWEYACYIRRISN